MLKPIKKTTITNLKDIYALLGVSWQTVYKWRDNSISTQSRGGLKHDFIVRAGELFSLNSNEKENLANKAGLSLLDTEFSTELTPLTSEIKKVSSKNSIRNIPTNINFATHFGKLLATYTSKKIELCEAALVSDRMFRHVKSGCHLKKEPLLAILIAMGLAFDDIQSSLKKAGFFLSASLPNDSIIMWMIENGIHDREGAMRLHNINETLYSLDLPLLMTKTRD